MGCSSSSPSGAAYASHSRFHEEAATAAFDSPSRSSYSGMCFGSERNRCCGRATAVSEPEPRRISGIPVLLGDRSNSNPRAARKRTVCPIAEVAREQTTTCGPQSKVHRGFALDRYETECRDFVRRNPKVAAAYARLAGELHDAERVAAGAMMVGLGWGLALTTLDPTRACKKVAVEDWQTVEQAMNSFVWHRSVTLGSGTFEPQDCVLMQEMMRDFLTVKLRAEAFLGALRQLLQALMKPLRELRRALPEAAAPLTVLGHTLAACTPPFEPGFVEEVVVNAFHIAVKAERTAELPAIHLVRAAWDREPRGAVQWHHAGQYLGTICLAIAAP